MTPKPPPRAPVCTLPPAVKAELNGTEIDAYGSEEKGEGSVGKDPSGAL